MDTVVLVIPRQNYQIIDGSRFKDRFQPINHLDYSERRRFAKTHKCVKRYVQNPSVELRREGTVYPYLTIYERLRGNSYTCDLHISVSLPKLLYGHSFKNVYTEQIDIVVDTLIQRLGDMGVKSSKESILEASVNTIHYSENIDFPSEQHLRMFLDRINKTSIGNWFEKNVRTYSNDGHAVRFHTNIFQIVFYMKYYDLFEAKNRCIDRKRTLQEQQIAEKLKASDSIPPVIRLEIRMAGKRSVSSHLNTVTGIKQASWRFQEVFSTELSKQFLLYYWRKILSDQLNYNLLSSFSEHDICQLVLHKNKGNKLEHILSALGMFYLLHILGVKDLKSLVILRKSRASWYRDRRRIVTFINRYVKANTELIDIVTKALQQDNDQLDLNL